MVEYLGPGDSLDEVSVRPTTIEGVATATAGFVGPTRYGPVHVLPPVITSLAEFERVYGEGLPLQFDGASASHNFLWQAVRAFFAEGGQRLFVARVFRRRDGQEYVKPDFTRMHPAAAIYDDGHARAVIGGRNVLLTARFPGSGGNVHVRFTFRPESKATGSGGAPLVTVTVSPIGSAGQRVVYPDLALDSEQARTLPFVITLGGKSKSGKDRLGALLAEHPGLKAALVRDGFAEGDRFFDVELKGGK